MGLQQNYRLRHCTVKDYLRYLIPRKRMFVWLFFLLALTGAWIAKSSISFNEIINQNYTGTVEAYNILQSPMSVLGAIQNEFSRIAINRASPILNMTPTNKSAASSASQLMGASNPDVSQHEPLRIFNVTNFTFVHNNAAACQGKSLIAIVHTAVSHEKRREVIRKTWAKNYPVFFMLGYSPTMNNTLVDEESKRYNDIIQGSFVDTYRNLTYKHVMGLHWVHRYCLDASIILKVDDDVYVNLKLLQNYVRDLRNSSKSFSETNCSTSMMLCDIQRHQRVLRANQSKWKVTKEEYQHDWYPQYCRGWNAIYSRKTISCLLEHIDEVPFFWIEDVYVNGFVANAAKVKQVQIERQRLGPSMSSLKKNLGFSALEKFANNVIIGPHSLGLQDMDYLGKIASLFN